MTAYEPCSQAFTCTHQINDLMNSKNIWSSLYYARGHA